MDEFEARQDGEAAGKTKIDRRRRFFVDWSREGVLRTVRCCNCLNGWCLACTALLIMILFPILNASLPCFGSSGLAVCVTSVSLCILGLVLCLIELNFAKLRTVFMRNIGFAYTYSGRCLLILFASTMCFSLYQTDAEGYAAPGTALAISVATVTFANAIFNLLVYLFHPALRRRGIRIDANPHEADTMADDAVGAASEAARDVVISAALSSVVVKNPVADLMPASAASQVASGAVIIVKQNPELVSAAIRTSAVGSGLHHHDVARDNSSNPFSATPTAPAAAPGFDPVPMFLSPVQPASALQRSQQPSYRNENPFQDVI